MKKKGSLLPLLRRLEALLLALLILYLTAVTAGSPSAGAAMKALGEALPLTLLRHELGLSPREEVPSPAAALTIAQSPLLLSARAALQREEAEAAPPEPPEEEAPAVEIPAAPTQEQAQESAEETAAEEVEEDNGVPARTLIPTDPQGYTVWGKCWISSSRETPLSEEDRLAPCLSPLEKEAGEPQILIVHTHGSEAYTPKDPDSVCWSGNRRSTDVRYSVIHVGDVVAEELSRAGFSVLHDRCLYDYPQYQGSYDRSLAAMEAHLEKHPGIAYILDIHRDAIEDKEGNQYKAVARERGEGGALAQMSLVVGSDGSGLSHPRWRENLGFAIALQERLLEESPTLMRPILLRKSRYNQHLTPCTLLLEVGAAGNSPKEAERSARRFAQSYIALLSGQ